MICQNKEKGFFATTGFFVKTRLLSMALSPARFEDKPWSGAKKQQQPIVSKKRSQRPQNRAKENQPKRQRRGISGQWRERERKVQLDTEGISFFRLSKRIVGYVGTDDPL